MILLTVYTPTHLAPILTTHSAFPSKLPSCGHFQNRFGPGQGALLSPSGLGVGSNLVICIFLFYSDSTKLNRYFKKRRRCLGLFYRNSVKSLVPKLPMSLPLRCPLGTGNQAHLPDSVQDIFAQVKIPQVAQGLCYG